MIEWVYRTVQGQQITFQSDFLPIADVLAIITDMQKTGRLHKLLLTDEYHSSWTVKELQRYIAELETEPANVELYFDGGFLKQQQLAGLGAVIYFVQNQQKMRLRVNRQATDLVSNNEAEYAALYEALKALEDLGVHHQAISVKGDAQIVISQMSGDWPIYEQELQRWAQKIDDICDRLKLQITYEHIERAHNGEADRLATQALEGTSIHALAPVVTKRQRRRNHD